MMRRMKCGLGTALVVGLLSACGESGVTDPGTDLAAGEWEGVGGIASFAIYSETCTTIDFDGYSDGELITTVPSGFGFDLTVTVEPGGVQSTDEARIFDANANTPTNDPDLRDDSVGGDCAACGPLGNMLIIESQEGYESGGNTPKTPDDSRDGGKITYSGFTGNGTFVFKGFTAIDDDSNEQVFIGRSDGVQLSPTSSQLGNGSVEPILFVDPHSFENNISIEYYSSGATDNLEICKLELERGEEGCTPGYWRQPQHADSWNGISPDMLFGEVFTSCVDVELQRPESGNLCELTLLEAVVLRGGGVNALARHAVAAYLNANLIDYYWLESEVLDNVNGVFDGDQNAEVVHGWLADANESYCPLN